MNTKGKDYKRYLEVQRKLDENTTAQALLGYKPLEKPIHDGYNIELILRDDVARREDAWKYEYLLEEYGVKKWCRTKDFQVYSKGERRNVDIEPHISKATLKDGWKWNAWFAAFWEHIPSKDEHTWWGIEKHYECVVPDWMFKTKITKHYRTHYKVIDEVLLQEESFLHDLLWSGEYKKYNSYRIDGPTKSFRQKYNRSDRQHSKQTLKYNMTLMGPRRYMDYETHEPYEDDEDWDCWPYYNMDGREFRYQHRHSARWDWW